MTEIKLETLTEADLHNIYQLLKEPGIEEAGITGSFSLEQTKDFLDELMKDSWHKKIVSEDDIFMGIVLVNSRGLDRLLINTKEVGIVVANNYRGQGVGTVAIKEICKLAQNNGITELWASTYADNVASQTIFMKNDFEYKYDADFSMIGLPIQKYYLRSFNH